MSRRLRVGAVAYLNARPLVHGIERGLGAGRLELVDVVPAELSRAMARGEIDLGVLPVIDLGRIPGLEIVPGLGIVSAGPARSVLLVSRVPAERVRSVALDPESRTSNALVQVLFAHVWRARPSFVEAPAELGAALELHDAAVRIGDKALFEPLPADCQAWDLGEIWTRATTLPFVFAVWAARSGVVDRELYRLLHASRRAGSAAVDEIAESWSWRGRRDPALAGDYLRRAIRYRLGSAEMQGLSTFLGAAATLGLIDAVPELRFALRRHTGCDEIAAGLRGTA